jgi:DNA-binding MarR family transcriptional regulator
MGSSMIEIPRALGCSVASLGDLLYALLSASDRAERAMAARLGMGVTDAAALHRLLTEAPAGPSELGRALGLGSAAATVVVDRLEAAGHLERRPRRDDRRRVELVPTEHARREAARAIMPLVEGVHAASDGMSDEEQAAVAAWLRRVAVAYEHYIATAPGPGPS